MSRRLLELCLLAYPRPRRESDREYLRDLALELAENYGLARQALSLLRGGLSERLEAWGSRRGPEPFTRMKRLGLGSLVLAVVGFTAAGLASGETEVERFRLIDSSGADRAEQSIRQFLDRTLPATASGTLVAARGGKAVYCEGFGIADRAAKVPAGCDTVYDVMSMTKQFTAAGILKLQMLGKLQVSDPIGKYVGPVPAGKRAITVRQLLTHTSGLVDALGDDYDPLTREQMVAGALGSKLESKPGARYGYSNLGYSLLAAIIEQASGMAYEEFLAQHLFGPAGMTQTGYVLPDWKRDRVAVEYDPRGKSQGRPFDHPWAADGPFWNLRGNGGMLSTARDMLRWHRALLGNEVLDRSSRAELFKPRVLEEPGGDTRYAYGWVIQRSDKLGRIAWHDGGNGWSFGVITRVLDDGDMVFWVTNRFKDNARGWSFYRLARALTEGVLGRLGAASRS
jgi:CubicO group peptidase (beta-lactamase class C family)